MSKKSYSPGTLCVCVFSLFVVPLLIIFLTQWFGRNPPYDPIYCCPDVVELLIRSANMSMEPCSDFYGHTCYNWAASKQDVTGERIFNEIFSAAFQGKFSRPAGKAIFAFVQSCLAANVNRYELLPKTVSALAEKIIPSGNIQAVNVLRTIVRLSLLYELISPVGMLVDAVRGHPTATKLVLLSSNASLFFSPMFTMFRQSALSAFNKEYDVNVSMDALSNLARSVVHAGPRIVTRDFNWSVLSDLVPNVTHATWCSLITEFYGGPFPTEVHHTTLSILRKDFALLTSGRGSQLTAALALVILEAASNMVRGFFQMTRVGPAGLVELFQRCEAGAIHVKPLWTQLHIEELTDLEKDRTVRAMFQTVKDAVSQDMFDLLEPGDLALSLRALSERRLILSSELHNPIVPFPVLGNNFPRNFLVIREYDSQVLRHETSLGINIFLSAAFGANIRYMSENLVLIPAQKYLFMNFHPGADPSINLAVVGVELAFNLWRTTLRLKQNSSFYKSRVSNMTRCVFGHLAQVFHPLSIMSAARAARQLEVNWNKPINVWGVSRLSRSQIFYMKYGFTYLCGGSGVGYNPHLFNRMIRSLTDFRGAFDCPSNNIGISNGCYDY